MKQYTKPTIAIAANLGNTNPVFCDVKADLDLIEGIVGEDIDWDKAFAVTEACSEGIIIDMYCKFTSAELGAAHAFIS